MNDASREQDEKEQHADDEEGLLAAVRNKGAIFHSAVPDAFKRIRVSAAKDSGDKSRDSRHRRHPSV